MAGVTLLSEERCIGSDPSTRLVADPGAVRLNQRPAPFLFVISRAHRFTLTGGSFPSFAQQIAILNFSIALPIAARHNKAIPTNGARRI